MTTANDAEQLRQTVDDLNERISDLCDGLQDARDRNAELALQFTESERRVVTLREQYRRLEAAFPRSSGALQNPTLGTSVLGTPGSSGLPDKRHSSQAPR